jgi:hypothetical protein
MPVMSVVAAAFAGQVAGTSALSHLIEAELESD